VGPPPPGPRDDERRRRSPLVPVLIVLAVLGVAGLLYLLFSNLGGDGGGQAPPVTTTAPAVTTTRSSPSSSSSSSSSTSSSSSSSSSTTSSKTSTTPSTTTTSAPADDAGLATFIKGYYADVTNADKRDATFAELTPAMQQSAGGRDGYESFWSTIKSVKVGKTQADASVGTVITELTFKPQDGKDIKEIHRLTVEKSGDSWLISADSKVG